MRDIAEHDAYAEHNADPAGNRERWSDAAG